MIERMTRLAMLAAVVVAVTLGGCALDKTSIEDRIASFIEDANAGRYSTLYKHLHSECVEKPTADAQFWKTTPFSDDYDPFALSGMSYGTTSTGQFTSLQPGTPTAITFVMKEEDSDDWYILSISIPGLSFLLD